jgi:hypothetical protein
MTSVAATPHPEVKVHANKLLIGKQWIESESGKEFGLLSRICGSVAIPDECRGHRHGIISHAVSIDSRRY